MLLQSGKPYCAAFCASLAYLRVKKAGLSLPAERLSCLYFQLVAYMDAICKKWLLKKYVFLGYRGTIKGSETVFTLGFCPKKKLIPFENNTPGFLSGVKILLLTEKTGETCKVCNPF